MKMTLPDVNSVDIVTYDSLDRFRLIVDKPFMYLKQPYQIWGAMYQNGNICSLSIDPEMTPKGKLRVYAYLAPLGDWVRANYKAVQDEGAKAALKDALEKLEEHAKAVLALREKMMEWGEALDEGAVMTVQGYDAVKHVYFNPQTRGMLSPVTSKLLLTDTSKKAKAK